MTHGGSGLIGWESADGKRLLYQQKEGDLPLLALPLNGGAVHQLIACVSPRAFAIAATGIYYAPCTRDTDAPIHLMDPITGTDRPLGTLQKYYQSPVAILTVSYDGRTLVYGRNAETTDLMLIENFR